MIRSSWFKFTALTAGLVLIGCGGDDGSSTSSNTTTTTTTTSSGDGGAGGSGQGGMGQGGMGQGGMGQGGMGQGGGPGDVCGDGIISGMEACDDGGVVPGDGCDDACAVEPGYACTGEPSACTTACGDGMVLGAEQCDDGDVLDGDGCSGFCLVEPGYTCSGEPSNCVTSCGDGVINGAEMCDDDNTMSGDGCSATCAPEPGYTCSGMPSSCATTCGDGVVVGSEACDDGDTMSGDGCSATCMAEPGFSCAGAPSICVGTCGDGIMVAGEGCDDGDMMSGDGCSTACLVEPGFTCNGSPSLCVTSCGDGIVAGAELCDDGNINNLDGCTNLCTVQPGYTCSGSPSVCVTGCGNGIISGGEGCDDGNTQAGDGCSTACAVEPGFTCSGAPSSCCMGESEPNNTAMTADGPLSPGAKACASINPVTDDDFFAFTLPTTGDVTIETLPSAGSGPCPSTLDTVIDLFDTDGTTLIATGDNKAAGDYCSRISPTTTAAAIALPAGTYYVRVEDWQDDSAIPSYRLWVRATVCGNGIVEGSEQCDGGAGCNAVCQLAAPNLGESLGTAQPWPGCNIAPTSQARVDVPSCFPASGGVHWYAYTTAAGVLALTANAQGPVALYDGFGQELGCTDDATQRPLGALTSAGGTVYVAVSNPTPITCLTFAQFPYSGVGMSATDINVTFATAPTSDYGMTNNAGTLFLGTTTEVYAFPKTGNMMAAEHGAAEGLGFGQLGYDLHFANGNLISINATASPSVGRIYRVFDQASNTWGPTAWDMSPSYPPSSPFYTLTYDGATMLAATRSPSGVVHFYSFSASAASQPVQLGMNNTVDYVVGLAADSQFFYVAGEATDGPGVFRISRANIAAPAVRIADLAPSTVHNSLEVDNNMAANYLYVRVAGDIHVVVNPGGFAIHPGNRLSTLGNANDFAMTLDAPANRIYFLETESTGMPRIMRLQ